MPGDIQPYAASASRTESIPPGSAQDPANAPSLFKPFKIRGIPFQNRIWYSPMCLYSAEDGYLNDWHFTHYASVIMRGPSMAIMEATAVLPEGRISPRDLGIWTDSHIPPLKRLVDFVHSHDQKIGIQLAHAGRKASTQPPWADRGNIAKEEHGGWPDKVFGASPTPFGPSYAEPKVLDKEGIRTIKQAFVDAAKRAVQAGFDAIEVHSAHGYLMSSFLSPASNKRTDEYGGSFENRIRLTLEVVDEVRAAIPATTLLFVRISATDWLEHLPDVDSWRVEDSARLAKILATRGVDLLDISAGSNDARQKIKVTPGYQAEYSHAIRQALRETQEDAQGGMLISAVGAIPNGTFAQHLLDEGKADVILAGRLFLRNPGLVWAWADELEVLMSVPNQLAWPFKTWKYGISSGSGKAKY